MKLYHGTPSLFKSYSLDSLAEGSGIKFGAGIYLTEVYDTAALYSFPRGKESEHNYVYTVEVPDKTEVNYLPYPSPVQTEIIEKVEAVLKETLPEIAKSKGKFFRKYLAHRLVGVPNEGLQTESKVDKATTLEGEKMASQLLLKAGVLYIEWPQGGWKSYPKCQKNYAVLDPSVIKIVQIEEIKVQLDDKGKFKRVLSSTPVEIPTV